MADLTEKEIAKLKKMKAVLGDDASQKVLDNAAARERAAQSAGIEMKEADTDMDTDTEMEDTEGQLSLGELLEQLEAGLEDGTIVDDISEVEGEEVDEPEYEEMSDEDVAELDADAENLLTVMKEVVYEVMDEKFAEFFEQMSLKEKASDPQVAAIQAKLKEAEANTAALTTQLNELLGVQPKSKPHRASQADETVVKESERPAGPSPDPVNAFISDFILPANGSNGNGVTR